MNVTPNQTHFTHYPTNHILGIVQSAQQVEQLCTALEGLSVPREDISVFHGADGRQAFDHGERGLQGWMVRMSAALTGTREGKLTYMDALEDEQYVVAVNTHGRSGHRAQIGQAFTAAGGRDVNLLGELVVDNLG